MTEYGYIFSSALHEKLKELIYAGVFVKQTLDDALEIVIARKSEDLIFKMYIDEFSKKILYGYSVDIAVNEIMRKYKKFIWNRYFI